MVLAAQLSMHSPINCQLHADCGRSLPMRTSGTASLEKPLTSRCVTSSCLMYTTRCFVEFCEPVQCQVLSHWQLASSALVEPVTHLSTSVALPLPLCLPS